MTEFGKEQVGNGLILFYSYAHEDEPFRKELEKHLGTLRHEGFLKEWHDRMITAGEDWHKTIHNNLDQANIILLLISPDFMASQYCYEVETQRAMQRYEIGTARVIPVLLRRVDWKGAPFSKLQAIPSDARPISEWSSRDAAFADVAEHIREVCKELAAVPGNPANPYVLAKVGDWLEYEVIMEIEPTEETRIGNLRQILVDKDKKRAVIKAEMEVEGVDYEEKTIEIPLDRPVEDVMGQLVSSVSEQIPPNAMIQSHQTGAGSEKLFIGSKTYYTTWIAGEVEIRFGKEKVVSKGKRWISSEVPLDGLVKQVMEVPGAITSTMIVTDYGRAGQRMPKPRSRMKTAEPVTLAAVMPGVWNVRIQQALGLLITARFEFQAVGTFRAEMAIPMMGPVTIQGRWAAQGNQLVLEGMQTTGFMNIPYAASLMIETVASDRLRGTSNVGERVEFDKVA